MLPFMNSLANGGRGEGFKHLDELPGAWQGCSSSVERAVLERPPPSSATAVWLADAGLRVLLVSSDPAHSTSDSLDVELGPTPVEVEGVPGLFGLEMDPEAKLSNLLPKVGEAVNNMGGNMGGLGGLGMMLDPSAKEELNDVKSDIKTADMILPGLDEALAFDELLKHMENPTWDVVVFDTAPTGHYTFGSFHCPN